jgi:hypothetical protein
MLRVWSETLHPVGEEGETSEFLRCDWGSDFCAEG